MALNPNRNVLEQEKFRGDSPDDVCVAVCNDDGSSAGKFAYEESASYVSSGSLASGDYESASIDVTGWRSGYMQISWASYDGINGAINIQTTRDGTIWSDWGGLSGVRSDIATATGDQSFEFTDIQATGLRFVFYVGNGTAGTVDASYIMKAGK